MNLSLSHTSHPLILHPERAVELPGQGIIAIADVHWGKATHLRANGVPVPPGGTSTDLARLDRLLARTAARHLLILGDLAHSRHGWDTRALAPVLAWRERWPSLEITLVRGNHDRHAGDPPASLGIHTVSEPFACGSFTCAHEPPDAPAHGITLCGHLHPTIALAGRGDRVRLPCFVLGAHHLMLPAFSAFTGSGAWAPIEGERAFAIVDDHVTELPVRVFAGPSARP